MDLNYKENHLSINTLKMTLSSIVMFCFILSSTMLNAQTVLPYTATATAGMNYWSSTTILSRINDGNTATSGSNDYQVHPSNAIGKTITMTFGNNVNISSAIYYNRTGCCNNRIAGAQMIFKDVAGNVLYTFTFPASNGNVVNINDPLGSIIGVRSVELTNFQTNPQNFREMVFNGMSALPVELVSFEAANKEEKVNLAWITATEINNDGFEIQHSVNGIDFEKIGWEKGFGNTNKTQYYEFYHRNPSEVNYYRLKQIDFDGQFEYSAIRSIETDLNNDIPFEMYPNPTQNKITLKASTGLSNITIYNAIGENITNRIEFIKNSEQSVVLGLSLLSNGIYYIKTGTTTKKFIKQ